MKYVLLFLSLSLSAYGNSYFTSFAGANERPISEGGKWVNGLATGVSWQNCQVTNHTGCSDQVTENPVGNPVNDATAVVTGIWGPNQGVQAAFWIDRTHGVNTNFLEAELRLNTTISANSITGYEIDYSANIPGTPGPNRTGYIQIVRWNGPFNNFITLAITNGAALDIFAGDTLAATNNSGTIRAYINGTNFLTVVDSTYTAGGPGIGFDQTTTVGITHDGYQNSQYGFTNFYASDGITNKLPTLSMAGTLKMAGKLTSH